MKGHEQALLFLKKATEDEALLDAVLDNDAIVDATIGFHCQQAAEKLLKALLSEMGVRFQKTHDLLELIHLFETAGNAWPDELSRVDELTPFAIEFRYDDLSIPAAFNRHAARETVKKVRLFVERKIAL